MTPKTPQGVGAAVDVDVDVDRAPSAASSHSRSQSRSRSRRASVSSTANRFRTGSSSALPRLASSLRDARVGRQALVTMYQQQTYKTVEHHTLRQQSAVLLQPRPRPRHRPRSRRRLYSDPVTVWSTALTSLPPRHDPRIFQGKRRPARR